MSVVVALYNLRAFIGEAIDSVLGQTLPHEAVELIVVDDGSTDGGGDVARAHGARVRCLRQENRGLSAARNAGLAAAGAPFVLFLDADDRIRPEMLATVLATFERQPDVGLVYTGVQCIDVAGAPLPQHGWPRAEGEVLDRLVVGNLIHVGAAVARRDAVVAAGGFDETLASAEDWDLWLRLARAGVRWACVDRALAEYRIRPSAMHQHPGRMAENCRRALDNVFATPGLPAAVADRRPLAYQNLHLRAAADHYRAGDRVAGAREFRAAVAARPMLLTEPDTLAGFCRLLLPMGYQTGALMAARWRSLGRTLRAAMAAALADPGLAPLRWRAELAYWRTIRPLLHRRAKAALAGGRRRARLSAANDRLVAFERDDIPTGPRESP
ncbi:MAG TPA: glycosyltransferase [Candidatus Binatia bacterium]|nr:glycosyltransferase [Candidatus Binatia bacterium]